MYLAEEVHEPLALPHIILVSVTLVATLFVLVNVSYLAVLNQVGLRFNDFETDNQNNVVDFLFYFSQVARGKHHQNL